MNTTEVKCEAFMCGAVAVCDIEHSETGDIFSACAFHKTAGVAV
jgi:hypothetical protein